MLLAVVGSVKVNEEQRILARALVSGVLSHYYPKLFISGGADGIDSIAEYQADKLILPKRIHLPKNPRWKPEGYEERNLLIARDCTHLLCIRTSQSTTYGSGWTADRAEEMGKTVWRVTI